MFSNNKFHNDIKNLFYWSPYTIQYDHPVSCIIYYGVCVSNYITGACSFSHVVNINNPTFIYRMCVYILHIHTVHTQSGFSHIIVTTDVCSLCVCFYKLLRCIHLYKYVCMTLYFFFLESIVFPSCPTPYVLHKNQNTCSYDTYQ